MNFPIILIPRYTTTLLLIGLWSIFSIVSSNTLFAQLSVPGTPESFSISTKKSFTLTEKTLKSINIDSLRNADIELGINNRYSIVQELNINIKESAVKTEIPGEGYIWQYQLKSDKAFSLGILFKRFILASGSKVFIYTPDHSKILGAFTYLNNTSSVFAVADLNNNEAIIEYFEPYETEFPGELILGSVSIAYRNLHSIFSIQANINVNCSQGNNWQDEKRAVCRMTFIDGGSGYFCSGFLVNNLKQDYKPYFMSANHCISSSYSASTLVTYFNYENTVCNSDDASDLQTLSGAKLISNSAASDFSLMLLNDTPPPAYRAYLAGWDASGRSPLSGAGIHHPAGKPKAISIESSAVTLFTGRISWDNSGVSEPSTHWMVKFNSGNTEGGSSGSPFFDDNHRVAGQLHGGDESTSFYGAFKVSWDRSAAADEQLKNWLDPENSGIKFVDGKFCKSIPLALFSTENTKVCTNNAVILNDYSKYEPVAWNWSISPANYSFVNGSTRNSENPEVQFTEAGVYSIKLVVSNEFGIDSIQATNYFNVVSEVNVSFDGIEDISNICGCDLQNFKLSASGANDYVFNFNKPEKIAINTVGNNAFLSMNDVEKKNGNFSGTLSVQGNIGTCTSSDSVFLNIALPVNDDIQDAIMIYAGKNGPYSNYCASGQTKEPFPGPFNCTSNTNWCPGTTANGIQNSIWFQFIGPSDGLITIDTKGTDTRIAIFEADSIAAILSGKPTLYDIVGANDNRSSADKTALLEDLDVTPGKKYWLLVESLDADTGSITISIMTNSLEVFPNPTDGLFDVIVSNKTSSTSSTISVYSSNGTLLFSKPVEVSPDNARFSFNLSGYPAGLYYVKAVLGDQEYSKKIVLLH